jgi:hypothetical protein
MRLLTLQMRKQAGSSPGIAQSFPVSEYVPEPGEVLTLCLGSQPDTPLQKVKLPGLY